mmetsp:Transcript_95475/g.179626  ORF Transcript_95475/g.179626 Transcript_95475/m.179626 type:complete len:141 (+) Transcript_95475:270-692(+)
MKSGVMIADCDCTSGCASSCREHNVRAYPTLKYFTNSNGREGSDWGGDRSYTVLEKFVSENLDKRCVVQTRENCTEHEVKYIEKQTKKDHEALKKELERLRHLDQDGHEFTQLRGSHYQQAWLERRISILEVLVGESSEL